MSDESQANGETDESVGIQDGDFIRLSYTLRTAEDGRVVDTTDAETAEEAEIDTDEYDFEPRIIVVGAGHLFDAVDEELVGAEPGDVGTVEIPAAEAFGEYEDDQVRTISASKIDEDDRYPGEQVQLDGEQGQIVTIVSGRARVDFNHPLAGDDLEYEYEILEEVEDRDERAGSLLGMYLQEVPEVRIETDVVEEEQTVAAEETEEADEDENEDDNDEPTKEVVEVEKETLYIEATPQMTMNQQWLFQKQQIAQDIIDRLELDRVIVQETIEGMGGMMGGLGGMMGGDGMSAGDIEDAVEDVDVDADELAAELEGSQE